MSEFLVEPVQTDPEALAADMLQYIRDAYPGWNPAAGNPETIFVEANARAASIVRDILSQVRRIIYADFARWAVQLPRITATPASGQTTWTVVDAAGYTIPAGTNVVLRTGGDTTIGFRTLASVTIPPGSTATATGGVTIAAITPGSAASGITGTVEPNAQLPWVAGIVLEAPTTGGTDGETEDAYLERFQRRMRVFTARPIVRSDFEVLAHDIPGVGRALAIDGYNPGDLTSGNERMVDLVVTDADGEPLTSDVKTALADYLQSMREVNFVVFVSDADYSTVDVTYAAVALPNFDPVSVKASVDAALAGYFSPGNWGLPRTGERPGWDNKDTIRYLEVAQVINDVYGIDYLTALTLGLNGGAQTAADHVMAGVAPLTRPGTFAGTVT